MNIKKILTPAAAAAALVIAVSAQAAPSAEFNVLMNEGVGYYKAGNYTKAIETFQKAQKIENIPDITYNIAKSYQLMGDCDLALKYFREYALTSSDNAQSVQSYIETLNTQCGTKTGSLVMKCTPSDAMVTIDYDAPVQCNATYELKTGEHQLKFTAKNYIQETRTVDITENQPRNIVIEMKSNGNIQPTSDANTAEMNRQPNQMMQPNGQMPAPYGPPPEEEISNLFWAGVGTAGGGLVFSIAGIAMLATAHHEVSVNGHYDGFYDRSTSKLAGGAVLAGIGVTAMTTGVIILVVDKFLKKRPAPAEENTVSFAPAITVMPDSASASLTMTF